ncbi:hypothetical protein PbJCM13498_12490 [Prolixibacter bellariivorans]|uniref:Carboxypeptidase-like regulatory domain-containing protein n=1 Tax=Prolixibacter bellariivorans TaxID=314319 RepID=A0A5M4AXS0_9BACT|nr:hypothetical protein [Prolixibacter bellariivorans]GET32386.1 hypothetical protein PbJCM13498_12490 [Prolixibacter bellariivorans]
MNDHQRRLTILLFLVFLSTVSHAQIRVVDGDDHSAISFAQLIAPDGRLVGTSNTEGKIDTVSVNCFVKNSDSLVVQHLSYENSAMTWKQMKLAGTILLAPREIALHEITVTNKKEKMVLVLKGFFRSYQLKDSIPEYFADGIVEYYIWNDGKRFKCQKDAYRLFRNQELLDAIQYHAVTVSEGSLTLPYIEPKTIVKQLNKNYSIDGNHGRTLILKEDSVAGSIRTDEARKQVQINIDWIAPAKVRERSLFGYQVRITHHDVTETYLAKSQSMASKANLESWRRYYQYFFKQKKETRFKNIQTISEFYVLESYYIPKSVMQEERPSSGWRIPLSHSYTTEYWEHLDERIPPLNPNIKRLLGATLMMYD